MARFRQMTGGNEKKDCEGIDALKSCGSIWNMFGWIMPKLNEIDIHIAIGGYCAIQFTITNPWVGERAYKSFVHNRPGPRKMWTFYIWNIGPNESTV